MAVLFTAMFSGIELIWDRQFGFRKETLVAPVPRIQIMIGRTRLVLRDSGLDTSKKSNGSAGTSGETAFQSTSFCSMEMAHSFHLSRSTHMANIDWA